MDAITILFTVAAGDARTKAMVGNRADDEDAIFDNFADPAGLIMQQTISANVPRGYPGAEALYKQARNLKLPHNPLVSIPLNCPRRGP